ncbi:MAG: D-alanyl-D-alanine carboxypeptidase [Salinibacterium sp.]|nr:D-alanyl-D-alanine carboxypeptidase [Salinibacterium sp.]MBF0673326.1 D-alanyl-D-alanine carboxypeptidase [Salinibacterium sp.]
MIEQETPPSPRRAARRRAPSRAPLASASSWFAARPRAVLAVAAGIIVAAMGTGAVAAGASSARPSAASIAVQPEAPEARVVPELAAAPVKARTCAVDTSDPAFAALAASVINVTTGEQLLSRGGDEPVASAALHKLHTAAVALKTLGPDTRLVTRVYEGSIKGSIVIVGGGDPTLSALPDGVEGVYPGAPRMSELASQTRASLDRLYPGEPRREGWFDRRDDDEEEEPAEQGEEERRKFWDLLDRDPEPDWEVTQVVVDAGMWAHGDKWDATWPAADSGEQANILPLMVDGDRTDPAIVASPRTGDPVGTATAAFIGALGLSAAPEVIHGGAITDRPLLAEVYSQPVSVLVQHMLHMNDNTLADMLARLSSKAIGGDGSAASLQQLYESALLDHEIPGDGFVAKDGSGLSVESAALPAQTARLLAVIASGYPGLEPVHTGLPVAGVSGPLAHRFSGELSAVHSAFGGVGSAGDAATTLGGILTAADGAVLALALQSTGEVTSATGLALESLVAEIHACGDNLADVHAP